MPEKEIGKLLELLNEYSKEIGYFNEEDLQGQTKAWILSKEFGWIKWLVENDKIDLEKLPIRFEQYYQNSEVADYIVEDEKILIMLLSISEQPIHLLISLLKDGK